MPDMSGGEVASVLKRERPTLPTLLFSGFIAEVPLQTLALVDAAIC